MSWPLLLCSSPAAEAAAVAAAAAAAAAAASHLHGNLAELLFRHVKVVGHEDGAGTIGAVLQIAAQENHKVYWWVGVGEGEEAGAREAG